jgi:hypothetical protein
MEAKIRSVVTAWTIVAFLFGVGMAGYLVR